MGCWNETCALTNLPIHYGEEVVMLVLAHLKTLPGKNYYYNDEAVPFCLPIYGEYNDYGSIEKYEMSELTRRLIENTLFYTCDNEGKYKVVTVSMDELIDMICAGDIYIKYPFTNYVDKAEDYTPLSSIMYHRGAFELIQNNMKSRIPYQQNEQYYELLRTSFLKKLERNNKWKEENQKYAVLADKNVDLFFTSAIWGENNLGYKIAKAYEKILDRDSEEECGMFSSELASTVCFFYALDIMRKSFFGMCGRGSQSDEMYFHKLLANWTLSYIEKRQKYYMEEDDDEVVSTDENIKETLFWWKD